jgi:predicted  nucleic acid-binding Zn-ribbon protein
MANSRLHWKTQEITDLESEIRKIEEERDHLERSIRNVTTEPFLRKEGQNVQARIADLELKLKERSNVA